MISMVIQTNKLYIVVISGERDATYRSVDYNPENMRRWAYAGLLLGQRRRRWANNKPALVQRLMFIGNAHGSINAKHL